MNTWQTFDVERRQVMQGLATIPLASILADRALAQAVAEGLETVSLVTEGGQNVSASLAMPDVTPAPTLVLIHEWWGLRDEIRAVAAEYAKQGYIALAVDLYNGQNAETPPEAMKLTQTVKDNEANDTLASWIKWLKDHPESTGKVGTVGWCFGGKWSLNASLVAPVDATVVYYGNVMRTPEQLAALNSDVLGHFGTKDRFINKKMVDGFEAAMTQAGKSFTTHWYDADHAFSNPTGAAYDEEDAQLAWSRTLAYFDERLKATADDASGTSEQGFLNRIADFFRGLFD